VGVGHGHQVVAGVVAVVGGLADVIHRLLEPIETVIEVGRQEHFTRDTGNLGDVRFLHLDDIVIGVVGGRDGVALRVHGLDRSTDGVVERAARGRVVLDDKGRTGVAVVLGAVGYPAEDGNSRDPGDRPRVAGVEVAQADVRAALGHVGRTYR